MVSAKRILGALLLPGLLLCAAAAARPQTAREGIRTLEPDSTIERGIAPGESHAYRLYLEAGQFLRAVVYQRGIDLVVAVIGPDGRKISEFDSPNGAIGPEDISLVPGVSGMHLIEVRPLEANKEPGRYSVRIEELLTAAEYGARLAEERAAEEAARNWLSAEAVRLRTVEAGHGFADMQPLGKMIGDARIVSLGEATHGSREFFQLKHRILEFLVSEMGFTIFAIEAAMPESFDINEYVLTGRGDPEKALAGIYFWTWDTEEVLALIEWMRRYNEDPRHTRKVGFYGFDMQSAPRAAKVTMAYLLRVDPRQAERAEGELGMLANPYTEPQFADLADERKAAAAERIEEVLSGFEANREAYIDMSSADEWSVARQHVRVLAQYIEMLSQGFLSPAMSFVRDRSMAENIGWILDREGPGSKAVVWAHNGHVAKVGDGGSDCMGSHLSRMFGDGMVVFGFAFNRGGFQAIEMPLPSERGLRSFEVDRAPDGSLDAMLASAGLRIAAIDLRALPEDGPAARWFGEPRASRSVGAGYAEQFDAYFWDSKVAPEIYDALLFVEKVAAARPVRKGDGPGPAQKLDAPSNTDFELGEVGEPPADWQARSLLRRYDFRIETTGEDPHRGERCAMICRMPGRRYGEIAGSFSQRIDAAGYRGRKIKLSAAARAVAPGPGDLSWLKLVVSRREFGPRATIFDSEDRCPVASVEWRVYEIVADVPQDADAISYGLVLVGDGKAWLDSVSLEVMDD